MSSTSSLKNNHKIPKLIEFGDVLKYNKYTPLSCFLIVLTFKNEYPVLYSYVSHDFNEDELIETLHSNTNITVDTCAEAYLIDYDKFSTIKNCARSIRRDLSICATTHIKKTLACIAEETIERHNTPRKHAYYNYRYLLGKSLRFSPFSKNIFIYKTFLQRSFNLEYSDSKYWERVLNIYDLIHIHDIDSEIWLGTVHKRPFGFFYTIGGDTDHTKTFIDGNYINIHLLDTLWHIINMLARDKQNVATARFATPYTENKFEYFFTMNATYFDQEFMNKVLADFKKINPGSNLTFMLPDNSTTREFHIEVYPKNNYGSTGYILYTVTSETPLNCASCFRLAALLDNFSTGSEDHNSIVKHLYKKKENIFVDNEASFFSRTVSKLTRRK